MADSKSFTVRSGMTKGVCSTVVLLDEVSVDILGELAGRKGEEGRGTRKSKGPGPSMGILWGAEGGERRGSRVG